MDWRLFFRRVLAQKIFTWEHLLLLICVFWIFDLQEYDIRTWTHIKSDKCNYVEIKSKYLLYNYSPFFLSSFSCFQFRESIYNKHVLYNQWIFRFFLVLSSNEKPHKNTCFALLFFFVCFVEWTFGWLINQKKTEKIFYINFTVTILIDKANELLQ
jgi:hypothetical protein